MYLVTEKGFHKIIPTSLSEAIQEKKKNRDSFVGSCPVSTASRHVRSTQKEHVINHMVCSGKANDERNREHVVLNLLSHVKWTKSTRKLDP